MSSLHCFGVRSLHPPTTLKTNVYSTYFQLLEIREGTASETKTRTSSETSSQSRFFNVNTAAFFCSEAECLGRIAWRLYGSLIVAGARKTRHLSVIS